MFIIIIIIIIIIIMWRRIKQRFLSITLVWWLGLYFTVLVVVVSPTPTQAFLRTTTTTTHTPSLSSSLSSLSLRPLRATTNHNHNENDANNYNQNHNNNNHNISFLSQPEIARYSRHLVLPDVGVSGQVQLKQAAVLVVGAGGLGSPCLLYLAAAGVGHIGIVDADTVDASNLQRQIIHGGTTVGQSKCQSAAQRIRDINPYVQLRLYQQEFTADTAMHILSQGFAADKPYTVLVDGSDNFPTKYLIK